MCEATASFPDNVVVRIGQFQVGLIHGDQVVPFGNHAALGAVARRLGVDILVHGHTGKNEIFQSDGKFYLNPGSVSGSVGFSNSPVVPSFMLIAVQGPSAVVYVYEFADGKANVSMSEFRKPDSPASN